MKKFENRALDNFFRSKVKEAEKQDRGWNNPPEDLFDEAMGQIAVDDKKHRRVFPIYVLFGLLGLIVIGAIFISNKKIIGISEKVNEIEHALQINNVSKNIDNSGTILSESKSQKTESTAQTDNTPINSNSIKSNQTFKEAKNTNKVGQKSTKLKFVVYNPIRKAIQSNTRNFDLNNINNVLYSDEKATDESSINQLNDKLINQSNDIFQTKNRSSIYPPKNKFISPLSTLIPSLAMSAIPIDEEKLSPAFMIADITTQRKIIPFQVELFSGINFSSLNMSNISMSDNASLTEYDKIYSGYSYGVSGQYNVNQNFSVAASLTRNVFHNNSLLAEARTYQSLSHFTDKYYMDMDIMSPIGSVSSTATFDIGNQTIDQSDILVTNTTIDQKIKTIGFSLGAKYYFSLSKSTKLFTGIGYTYESIGKINNEFDTSFAVNSDVISRVYMSSDEMNNAVNNFSSLYGQIGIEQKLTRNLSIGFRTQMNRSISSLRQYTTATDPSTHIRYLNSNIGIIYKL